MPYVTKHTPKVSTRSVKPYACESSREKWQQDRQQDRQTETQTDCPKPLFSTFWGLYITSQIRSYLEVDFLHDANTSIDMEVIYRRCDIGNLAITRHCKCNIDMRYSGIDTVKLR